MRLPVCSDDCILDLGKFFLECPGQRQNHVFIREDLVVEIAVSHHLINAVVVGMKFIIRMLILNPQKDQNSARDANG